MFGLLSLASSAGSVLVGLGCIVALHYRASTSYGFGARFGIYLYFRSDGATGPQVFGQNFGMWAAADGRLGLGLGWRLPYFCIGLFALPVPRGFGRIAASEIAAPNLLVNLV